MDTSQSKHKEGRHVYDKMLNVWNHQGCAEVPSFLFRVIALRKMSWDKHWWECREKQTQACRLGHAFMEIVWSFLKGSKIELHEIQQPEHGLKGGEPYFFLKILAPLG